MSDASKWGCRCSRLADMLFEECCSAMPATEIKIEDRSKDMLAEEEDPNVVPFYPIGMIYRFRIRQLRTHHLFGRSWLPIRYWRTLVSFGLEEMRNAPSWTAERGAWCTVDDPALVERIRLCMQRFSEAFGIKLDFSGATKDP